MTAATDSITTLLTMCCHSLGGAVIPLRIADDSHAGEIRLEVYRCRCRITSTCNLLFGVTLFVVLKYETIL